MFDIKSHARAFVADCTSSLTKVQLELTRSFVENQDGTYDVYVPKDVDSPPPTAGQGATTYLPVLKPFELKTYLKIGISSLIRGHIVIFALNSIFKMSIS